MAASPHPDPATDQFVQHRRLLFTVAYEILGSVEDAEDVVQETWLRWAEVAVDSVENHRAYLVRIAARQALNRLRTVARRRETYTGPWLPEPLLTAPDVAEYVEAADSLSMAMLIVLESLTPVERVVFVLREVFDLGYDEITQAIDKSAAATRQIAHRARKHVAEHRQHRTVAPGDARAAVTEFRTAIETGQLDRFLAMLAPDVVVIADGGGIELALLYPVTGRAKVAKLIAVAWNKVGRRIAFTPLQLNGAPGLFVTIDGAPHSTVSLQVAHGQVIGMYIVRNPEKLSRLVTAQSGPPGAAAARAVPSGP